MLLHVILTGDFNLPGTNWSESLVKHDSSYKAIHEHSLEILHGHGLQQLVTFPTLQVNTLDLVATNKPSSIINIQSSADVSDHDMVPFDVRSQVTMIEQPPRTIYMYHRANWDVLREELHVALTTDHGGTLEGTDVEQLWSKFKSSIVQVVNKYIPYKLTQKRHRLPWINNNIKRLIRKRDRLYNLYRSTSLEVTYVC